MELIFLALKAMAFGIAVAAPVGPMNILCMRRTLCQGWERGLATAVGIAMSDAFYSSIAALGLTGISQFILAHESTFNLVIGLFLIGFGIKIYTTKSNPEIKQNDSAAISLPYAFGSAMLMTLTNPLTILFFVTAFAAITPNTGFDHVSSTVTISGVFAGSFAWMTGVVVCVSYFRHVISESKRILIDRVTGASLVVFGVWELFLFLK